LRRSLRRKKLKIRPNSRIKGKMLKRKNCTRRRMKQKDV